MSKFKSLETLDFDNKALKRLPIDPIEDNYCRTVNNSCFSIVSPTPLKNAKLVSYSKSCLRLIDIDEQEIKRKDFVQYFSGNKILPGSKTASHCYCGHQFGTFAGQLGDGAVIYLGEIINSYGIRWELQLKGAGITPYSREADGRKVLRSSVREFLCSEAMHNLGVETTRSPTCITSDDKVVRDMFYDGNPILEKCTVISRIAPTFIRFGSFEIFKTIDSMTGRCGPSVGRKDILILLIDYVIETFFPDIKSDDEIEKYKMFYKEVVIKTAKMVGLWQTIGFCHGVLNTDNMSVLGLTLDYGPFGFMDRFDPDYVSNTSDDGGRYSFTKQPEICHWNLLKFAEALQTIIPLEETKDILQNNYYKTFNYEFKKKMMNKFGLFVANNETIDDLLSDDDLIDLFMNTMEKTGADFTNSFRILNILIVPGLENHDKSLEDLKNKLLLECSSIEELIEANESSLDSKDFQLFLMILQTNPQLLEMLGKGPKAIERVLTKLENNKKLKEITPDQKITDDITLWENWIEKYVLRIKNEIKEFSDDSQQLKSFNDKRIKIMNENNPKYILRNYLAKEAIESAENGDFTGVNKLLKLLETPYDENSEFENYSRRPPLWSCRLKVSCSS